MELLNTATVVLAQAVPFDVTELVKLGPGYAFAAYMLYLWGKERDRNDKLIEAHKVEIAAERSLNMDLVDRRLEDQKVLIPLASSITIATQNATVVLAKLVDK